MFIADLTFTRGLPTATVIMAMVVIAMAGAVGTVMVVGTVVAVTVAMAVDINRT